MNESMNFGNLGFSTVTEEKKDDAPAFSNAEQAAEKTEEDDTKVDVEEMQKKAATKTELKTSQVSTSGQCKDTLMMTTLPIFLIVMVVNFG